MHCLSGCDWICVFILSAYYQNFSHGEVYSIQYYAPPQKKETLSDYEYSVYLGFLLRKNLLIFFCFSIIWLSGFDEDYSRNTLFAIN
jgi:hypothetical protein